MNINHISVSRKKTFDTCAQQYKYRYHLLTPRPGPEPFYFTYGKIVHKIAEVYVKNQGRRSIGVISEDVLRGKIELEPGVKAPALPSEYKTKIGKHLRAIQNLTDKIGTLGHTEYSFKIDLDPPNGRFLVGFIDRLIVAGDKAYIIDYKTTKQGKWRVNKNTVKQDAQLRAYARVVQREFGIPAENIKTALFYLEGAELVAAKFTDSSLKLIEADLKDAYLTIENMDPDKVWGNTGQHCSQCEYCTLCPFFKSKGDDSLLGWDGDLSNLSI